MVSRLARDVSRVRAKDSQGKAGSVVRAVSNRVKEASSRGRVVSVVVVSRMGSRGVVGVVSVGELGRGILVARGIWRMGGCGVVAGTDANLNLDTGGQGFDQSGKRVVDGPQNRDEGAAITQREQAYKEGMTELNKLRSMTKDDPAAAKEIADLVKQMQQLDPSRFVGNPAMVEELHSQVLTEVDKLELQLRRWLEIRILMFGLVSRLRCLRGMRMRWRTTIGGWKGK